MNMSAVPSFAKRLEAVGHILDQRGTISEIVVQQADAGFIVHGLELAWGQERANVAAVSIVIEPEELDAALAARATEPVAPAKRWWS